MLIRLLRMRAIAVLGLGLWALASTAGAQVYRWVDPDGSIHYSDSPDSAPRDARVEVTKGSDFVIEPASSSSASPTRLEAATAASQPARAEPPPPQVQPQETGTDEYTVRQTFRNAHEKIAEYERLVAEQKRIVDSTEANAVAFCRGRTYECNNINLQQRANADAARARLKDLEGALRQWKNHLDDLERWASSKAIPRAWRQ